MHTFRNTDGTFNKAKIMSYAWALYRDLKRDCASTEFAYCLRAAWMKAKEAPESAERKALKLQLVLIETKPRHGDIERRQIADLRNQLALAA